MKIVSGISRILGVFVISVCLHVTTVCGGGDAVKVGQGLIVRAIQTSSEVSDEINNAA
jgi:hypothetical protein